MIKKIELEEKNMKNAYTLLDFERNKLVIIQNDEKIKDKDVLINEKVFKDLIDIFVPSWNFTYEKHTFNTDKVTITLKIEIDEESLSYHFNDKYPANFFEFMHEFKRLVDML